ncbi:hypothetical protein HNO52_18130 [Billgrantia diversa]|uniref:hypothetical protein n=1 Tax=Halomonas sp. MCCC 1A13316 TaxID=2733487 RepID=UPI0018A3631B|nr:hypothetical protein [Halomonas sp. MCCC 1A13316]QOR40223.1 hypothetical protein HNO52_18130 [Halomonas sp. MCCC 1A13316]
MNDSDDEMRQREQDRASGKLTDDTTKRSRVRNGESGDGRIEGRVPFGRVWDLQLEGKIRQRIQEAPLLSIIKLTDQPEYKDARIALEEVFDWLIRDGTLSQYRHNWFYRPKVGILGPRSPSQGEILRALMFAAGQRVAYITGPALYNQLGLTTQMPSVVTLATMQPIEKERLYLGGLRIKLIPARFDFHEEDIPALEILDALTALAKDPSLGSLDAYSILENPLNHIRKLVDKQPAGLKDRLVILAETYSAETRNAFAEMQLSK